MASNPSVLIITGYGLNCEAESKLAWELAGAQASLLHLHDLLENPKRLNDFQALMLIGGSSFGNHMGAGQILALRLRLGLQAELERFIEQRKLILGVGNGFQVMLKLGLLPALDKRYFNQSAALAQNENGLFQSRWVKLAFAATTPCVFTRGLGSLDLPISHGEGRFVIPNKDLLNQLEASQGVVCRYLDPLTAEPTMRFPANPNGSLNAIAGLCDPSGLICGLMPHPQAYLFPENHPQWQQQKLAGSLPAEGLGLAIFRNATHYLKNS